MNVIASALANSGVPAERLELEITFAATVAKRPLRCSISCGRSLSVLAWMISARVFLAELSVVLAGRQG
jgi:hypothetical protein